MCQEMKCPHKGKPLCSCGAVKSKEILDLIRHVVGNLCEPEWDLEYTTLSKPESRRLCVVGVCQSCGGRLCHGIRVEDDLAGPDLLAALYRHLYQYHNSSGHSMKHTEFRERFARMFHEQDRPAVRFWLEQPENQSVHTMYRRSKPEPVQTVYTIVHTSADADKGSFPPMEVKMSCLSPVQARAALERYVDEEKGSIKFSFDEELYRERCGDDFWDAYQEGYAAGWFTRFEIVSSPLMIAESDGKEG